MPKCTFINASFAIIITVFVLLAQAKSHDSNSSQTDCQEGFQEREENCSLKESEHQIPVPLNLT